MEELVRQSVKDILELRETLDKQSVNVANTSSKVTSMESVLSKISSDIGKLASVRAPQPFRHGGFSERLQPLESEEEEEGEPLERPSGMTIPPQVRTVPTTRPTFNPTSYNVISPLAKAKILDEISVEYALKDAEELQQFVTDMCVHFANATTTQMVQPDAHFITLTNRQVYVEELRNLFQRVTGFGEIRHVMRSFADETKNILRNSGIETEIFKRHNLPNNVRHLAFDYWDGCSSLSPMQRQIMQSLRNLTLAKTSHPNETFVEAERYQDDQARWHQ